LIIGAEPILPSLDNHRNRRKDGRRRKNESQEGMPLSWWITQGGAMTRNEDVKKPEKI
jgi:hypothetical protein